MDSQERSEKVRAMWETSNSVEIAAAIGTSASQVFKIAKRIGLKPKMASREEEPSPKEIARRSEAVRSQWTAPEERRRRVGWGGEPYTVPQLRNEQVFPAFQGQLK